MCEPKITKAYAIDSIENFKPEDIDAKVIVHFRPSPDWLGKGYGFDWMRIGDFKEVLQRGGKSDPKLLEGDIPFKGIVSKHFKQEDNTKLENNRNGFLGIFKLDASSLENLEREYKYHTISGKTKENPDTGLTEFERYYCSWLSVYPEKNAKLSLIIEVLDDTIPYEIKFNEDDFVKVDKLEKIDKLAKGRHIIPDAIEVKNLKALDEDTILKAAIKMEGIIYENDDVIPVGGKLILWPNNIHKQKIPKILNIFVKTQKNQTILEETFGSFKQMSEGICDYLMQMLIGYEDVEFVEFDLSDDVKFKPPTETTEGGYHYDSSGVVLRRIFYADDGLIDVNKSFVEKRLDHYLKEKFNEKVNNSDELKLKLTDPAEYIKIFFIDQKIVEVIDGSARNYGFASGKHIVLIGSDLDKDTTIVHELGHSFHLEHTFTNKEFASDAKFTFENCKTNNIMDYSDLGYLSPRLDVYTFFKWQWDIANKSINNDGSIKETT